MPIFNDTSKLQGIIEISLKDKNGKAKKLFKLNSIGRFLLEKYRLDLKVPFFLGNYGKVITFPNTITNKGKEASTSRLGVAAGTTAFTYLAVGTGTTAAAATDTALEAEITDTGLGRAAATVTQVTTTTTNDTLQLVKQWTASGAKAVTECGAFNAASGPVLLGRQVFSAVNVANTDILQITYKFVQA